MNSILAVVAIVLMTGVIAMLAVLLRKKNSQTDSETKAQLDLLAKLQERTERALIEAVSHARQDTAEQARALREEVREVLKLSTESLVQSVDRMSTAQQTRLDDFAARLEALKQASDAESSRLRTELSSTLASFKGALDTGLSENAAKVQSASESLNRTLSDFSKDNADQAARGRAESAASLKDFGEALRGQVSEATAAQKTQLDDFRGRLNALREAGDTGDARLRQELTVALNAFKEAQDSRLSQQALQLQNTSDGLARRLSEFSQSAIEVDVKARQELAAALKDFRESLQAQLAESGAQQKHNLDSFAASIQRLTETHEKKSDVLREAIDAKLTQIQSDNATKLEEMRRTVDEKLQGTLEKRLGDSFKLVSDRLEQVHKGLGEMQTLATGVGDLKRVLTNVKTRGTWSEVQLGNLLEQILTAEQFARNVQTKPSGRETVEFAVRLPGRDADPNAVVWLPIDAKFPKEDYERLVDAAERCEAAAVEQAAKDLEARIRSQARDIREKYLCPPHTTDFGILYLPTEGLYAEVIRRAGLADALSRDRVLVVGPTTLAALLNSLQMGFRTLAIQQRSSEVWKVLGAVKTEFGKFGDTLEKVKRKLEETGSTIEAAAVRSRVLERKLRTVEALPAPDAAAVLADPTLEPDTDAVSKN